MSDNDTTTPAVPVQPSTDKQRAYLLVLLKKHKGSPKMTEWWADLKPYWKVEEIAPGVMEGHFSDELPKRMASKYIELLKGLTPETPAKASFDKDLWLKRVGSFWMNPATSKIVHVRFAQKSGNPYGKAAAPGDTSFLFEKGLLVPSLVPLTKEEYLKYLAKHPGMCPICRAELSAGEEHSTQHADRLS